MPKNMYAWDMNVFLLLTAFISIVTSTKYKHALFAFGWISLWPDILLYQGTFDPKSRKHRRFCRILGGWWNLSLPHGHAVTSVHAFQDKFPAGRPHLDGVLNGGCLFVDDAAPFREIQAKVFHGHLGWRKKAFGVKKPGKVLDIASLYSLEV